MDAQSQKPIANWDPARDVWMKSPEWATLPTFELSEEFSETFPQSGSMRNGEVWKHPPLVPHTADSGYSSSPGPVTPPPGTVEDAGS